MQVRDPGCLLQGRREASCSVKGREKADYRYACLRPSGVSEGIQPDLHILKCRERVYIQEDYPHTLSYGGLRGKYGYKSYGTGKKAKRCDYGL